MCIHGPNANLHARLAVTCEQLPGCSEGVQSGIRPGLWVGQLVWWHRVASPGGVAALAAPPSLAYPVWRGCLWTGDAHAAQGEPEPKCARLQWLRGLEVSGRGAGRVLMLHLSLVSRMRWWQRGSSGWEGVGNGEK